MNITRTAEEKAADAYASSLARHTSLLSAFERSLKLTDECYRRLEREMYAPSIGGGGVPAYNAQHAKDIVQLSRALAQAGAVHARLLENESARADAMSQAEKVNYMVGALKQLPKSVREEVIRELNGP